MSTHNKFMFVRYLHLYTKYEITEFNDRARACVVEQNANTIISCNVYYDRKKTELVCSAIAFCVVYVFSMSFFLIWHHHFRHSEWMKTNLLRKKTHNLHMLVANSMHTHTHPLHFIVFMAARWIKCNNYYRTICSWCYFTLSYSL